ncbi:MAG: carotenoid 1,2-hydratase, partial [Rhodothermales bacterium]|nr:carotenoid 1,2-hydratase [Rhodothermales bacterium]
LYSAHLAIADPQTGEFRSDERYARGAAGLSGAEVEDGSVSVWVEDWTMMATEDLSEIRLEAAAEDMALSLVLAPAKPIFFQGENGYSPKGREDGQASHYYSITRLDASGTVRVGEEVAEVGGASWFDREWSTSLLSEDQEGWDWFSLQLDSGEDLMYFRLRSDIQDYVDGSLVATDGSRVDLDPDGIGLEVTDSWQSPRTGIRYPIAWRMQIPERGMDLTIEAALPNQELETRITYWEGMVRVSGTRRGASISGKGYVEMTGYGS